MSVGVHVDMTDHGVMSVRNHWAETSITREDYATLTLKPVRGGTIDVQFSVANLRGLIAIAEGAIEEREEAV